MKKKSADAASRPLARPVLVAGAARLGPLLAAAYLTELQGALAPPQLWQEVSLFERLLYKNRSQHRCGRYFQRCLEVKRHLQLLRMLQLPAMLALLENGTRAPSSKKAKPMSALPGEAWLPQRDLGFLALRRLQGGAQEAAHVTAAAAKAARDLSAMAAQGFFLPFCLTMIAMLARVHVYTAQMVLDCVRAYNATAELLPLLPAADAAAADAGAAVALRPNELPPMLACDWAADLPAVRSVPFDAGESWDARCAAAWELHGLSVAAHRQQQPAARRGQAAAGPVSTASGGELGVRVDRLTFAKQQPPPPPLGSIQDANAAPGAQGPQVIRFERAAAPLGANMAASARAADIVAPSSSAEHLPASGAIADGVSSEPGLPPLRQAQAPGPTHPAQQSSWIEPAANNPVVQPTSAASDAPPECGSELAARLGQQPSRVAAMLALQQAPPPRRPALNQPITPATAPAAVQQHSQMPSQPGPESSSAAPAASASVASPGPPQAMSSPAPQPAPPASTPDWGSSWAAAPGLGIGLTAVQAEAVAAAQQPFSAEVHLPQPNEAAASGEASALGHGAQSLPEATNRGVGTGQPAAALAAAPAPGVQAAAPQTRPSAASPTQLPAQPPQRDKLAWATHEGRRTLRQEARKRRRAQKSNTAPAKPAEPAVPSWAAWLDVPAAAAGNTAAEVPGANTAAEDPGAAAPAAGRHMAASPSGNPASAVQVPTPQPPLPAGGADEVSQDLAAPAAEAVRQHFDVLLGK